MRLLCIANEFAPQNTPTGIRTAKLVRCLPADSHVHVITSGSRSEEQGNVRVIGVEPWPGARLSKVAHRLRLEKLTDWLVWPDEKILWVPPAVKKAQELCRNNRYDAIAVFMMPYSAGLVGLKLKRSTGLPLLVNFDDSPTCSDMHPTHASPIHYRAAVAYEDKLVRKADAVLYVSRLNLERVRRRQPASQHGKFHLLRYGADPEDFLGQAPQTCPDGCFRIVYVGGMTGWYHLLAGRRSFARRAYDKWLKLGRSVQAPIDFSASSPVYLGRGIRQVLAQRGQWKDRLRVEVYGNRYPDSLVQHVLDGEQVRDFVRVHGPVPHGQGIGIIRSADLLFLTLPARLDGSTGGRISAKTYEYLMTDRPILAAVPRGENWDYLRDKPGVWLTDPLDSAAMGAAVREIAEAHFAGRPLRFDRSFLRHELSYATRAGELAAIISQMVGASGRPS